ncbi:MAG: DUF4139 domain-containing protein [Phycisphaerae bacterium]|nr:DUF4139 domain-containing protein [Phycisphaerae bacterium]
MICHARRTLLVIFASLVTAAAVVSAEDADGPAVTVYSSADPAGFDPQQFIAQQRTGYNPNFAWQVPGFAVVKEIRRVTLSAGLNDLPFVDVAQFIDPTTVSFVDLTDPAGTSIFEQNFQFDLVNSEKLLDKYIDQKISIVVQSGDKTETIEGILLSSVQGSLVLKTDAGVRIINGMGQSVMLGELPAGLRTRPTLLWKVRAAKEGEHSIRTTYQTAGMTWRADYTMVLNNSDTQADIAAWVSLMNLSGAGFKNAQLKLIAGDVHRVQPTRYPAPSLARNSVEMKRADADMGFEEKSFFEYHLYTLPRRTDVLSNTVQQISLFPTASGVTVEKLLVYYGLPDAQHWIFADPMNDRNLGTQCNKKLDVYVRFKNGEDNNLGRPLPKGKFRVYKQDDADGTLEFVGEDLIDHTPRNEKVLIKLGQAFDVVGERIPTDFKMDSGRKMMTESIKISLRNRKDVAQRVLVKENLYRWTSWEITKHSDEFEKIDSRTIHFDVNVPPDGEKIVTYTVQYKW